jgi:hypothetical protein
VNVARTGSNNWFVACSVSGTTITSGAASQLTTLSIGGFALSSTVLQLWSTTGSAWQMTLTGTAISPMQLIYYGLFAPYTNGHALFFTDGTALIVSSFAGTTTVLYSTTGMASNFIGIVQETVSAGSLATVLITGVDTHQSGLQLGAKYHVSSGTWTVNSGITDNDYAIAITSTSFLLR